MKRDKKLISVALGENNAAWFLVVVDLNYPTASDFFGIGLTVILFDDVDAVLTSTNVLGEEIHTDVLPVQHDFDRLDARVPGHTHAATDFKGEYIVHLAHPVVGVGQQHPVAIGWHAQHGLFSI